MNTGVVNPRVLLLTDADVFAGTERHMLDLAQGLRELGVEVQIGCPRPAVLATEADKLGIPVVTVQKCGAVDFAASGQLKQLLKKKTIDVIHAHNGRTHFIAARAVAGAGRGACVATQHFLSPSRVGRRGPKAWVSGALHRWTSGRTARVVAISDAVKQAAAARGEVKNGQMQTVMNGIVPPAVGNLRAVDEVRAELGIGAAVPMVFCAARLEVEKDVPTLVTAMKEVLVAVPEAHCFIAGTGQQRDAIAEQIVREGLGSRVKLLGFRGDVLSLIRAADLFVLPSPAEPFGLVIVEAMALGKAVVAMKAGGPCEIVEEGVTGLLTSPEDARGLAKAIIGLLVNNALREQYGQAGLKRYREQFTASRMAREMLEVYRGAMSLSSSPPLPSSVPASARKTLKVLLISHTCQSPTEGQPKAELLARMAGIELVTLIPDRWFHNGAWRKAAIVDSPACRYEVGKVALPWAGPGQFYLHGYPGLGKLLREFQPDVIDLWEEAWGLVSAQAVWLRNRLLPGCKVITETEQNINRKLPPPFEQFRRYVLKHADYAVCRNEEAISVIRSRGYRGEASVVPNAVDAELFRPLDRAACREKFGVRGFCVGYIGRFVERKGIQDMIAAIARSPAEVTGMLVGSGEYEGVLRKQIEKLGMRERIRIVSELPAKELTPVMNAIDVLVLPSRTVPTWKEQFGRVIIEAHACGTPVIGSDSGAIPEVIGGGGLVFQEGDVVELAARIGELAADREWAMQLGKCGLRQVHEHYTWKKVAERMCSLYKSVGNI